ncbi:MYB DNA-binding domain-containing protein [Colletotrichum tofieldiae]|nr:MYB DNA-binding domain-containing protein [Colletotrichum tofieldiae]
MAQASHPTLINLPPPSSRPDTPSEMPTVTGATSPGPAGGRGHAHHPSTTSLEAERADRISRLAGLERVSTLRAPPSQQNAGSSLSPQTTPTSTGFPPNYPPNTHLTPAYFDAHGQPTAVTKMSTVGTASATESYVGDDNETRTAPGEQDEDMFSMDTNYREADSVASMGADPEQMDEDNARSTGGYDDRMSDDGSASLVGFGEGANSTVSGPSTSAVPYPPGVWGLERSASGLSSEGIPTQRNRDVTMGGDTPTSAAAMQERRDARMVDGTTADGAGVPSDEMYVDTTNKAPVPASQLPQQGNANTTPTARDTAERLLRERLDGGESRAGNAALGSPQSGEKLGKFYFEERK